MSRDYIKPEWFGHFVGVLLRSKKLFDKIPLKKTQQFPTQTPPYVSALKSRTLLFSFQYGNCLDDVFKVPFVSSQNPRECPSLVAWPTTYASIIYEYKPKNIQKQLVGA